MECVYCIAGNFCKFCGWPNSRKNLQIFPYTHIPSVWSTSANFHFWTHLRKFCPMKIAHHKVRCACAMYLCMQNATPSKANTAQLTLSTSNTIVPCMLFSHTAFSVVQLVMGRSCYRHTCCWLLHLVLASQSTCQLLSLSVSQIHWFLSDPPYGRAGPVASAGGGGGHQTP